MGNILAILQILLFILIGIMAKRTGFRGTNVLLPLSVMYPVILLSRYLDRCLMGIPIPITEDLVVGCILCVYFIILIPNCYSVGCSSLYLRRLHLCMLTLVFIALASLLFNSHNSNDLDTGIYALFFLYIPFLCAFLITRTYLLDTHGVEKIALFFYLGGIITVIISVASALAPTVFATIISSSKVNSTEGRGFAPIGGPSAIGMQLITVYCISLGMLLSGKKKRISLAVAIMTFIGILSTVARAVIIVFVFTNVCFFIGELQQKGCRAFKMAGYFMLLLLPLLLLTPHLHSINRLTLSSTEESIREGTSVDIRKKSQIAAFDYGWNHLLLGGGWGLVYPNARLLQDQPSLYYLSGMETAFKPHTLFGLIFAELGLPGLVTIVLFWGLLLKYTAPPSYKISHEGYHIVRSFRIGIASNLLMCCVQDHFALVPKIAFFFYIYALLGCYVSEMYRQTVSYNEVKGSRMHSIGFLMKKLDRP